MKEINTRIDFFKDRPGMVIAELGVFTGLFSRELLTCNPDMLVLVDIWEGTVEPALQTGADFLADSFAPALDSISGAISDVIGWLQEMTAMLNSITLPGWLMPGSPTPFEIGLLGIADALKVVSKTALPDMNASLSVTGKNGKGLGMVDGGGMLAVENININANGLNEEQARAVVISALRELQFQAGIA